MATLETRTGVILADGGGNLLETRTGVILADGGSNLLETRTGVIFACDPVEPLSGTIAVDVALSGTVGYTPPSGRITATQRGYLQNRNAAHYLTVEVQDATATWRDLGAFSGSDYVLSALISDQLETPSVSATVSIRSGLGAASIAPIMSASTANATGRLLDVSRRIRVTMRVIPTTGVVTEPSYVTVFLGRIDRISTGNGQMLQLQCRDQLAQLLDASFDRRRTYGDNTTPLETVLQQMLTDVLGTAAPTIVTYTSPAWAPPGGAYAVVAKRGDNLWAKMTELLDQIGWILRYRWNGPNVAELRLFAPARTGGTSKYTLLPFEVRSVEEAALDLAGVRNSVQIAYYTAPTAQAYYTATDADSVVAYGGARLLIVAESKSSQINSSATAKRMGDAILSDLRISPYTHAVKTTHCFWAPESGDIMDVPANDVTHDSTQQLACINVLLQLQSDGEGNTATLQMRGQPASRGKSWLLLSGTSDDPNSGTGSLSTLSALTVTNMARAAHPAT